MITEGHDPREPIGTLDFEGRTIPVLHGDSVAASLYRGGVRVFTRSFKYHRRRGLYCLTGDCPNCKLCVDGEGGVRACVKAAAPGQRVRREGGWPSVDHDVFGVFDRMHRLLPVGFYYKTMLRPRWLWPLAEPFLRRLASHAAVDLSVVPRRREARHLQPSVAVIGGGVAGLSAALSAAEAGESVVICDEGRIAEKIAPGPDRRRVEELAALVRSSKSITVFEDTPAIGVYEGPLVVLNEPTTLHLLHPARVVVATGAVEQHPVFPGNDLPGVWLGRGAARLAGAYKLSPGKRVVLIGSTREVSGHADVLRSIGADLTVADAKIIEARGRTKITDVVIDRGNGSETLRCDALVIALGLVPRADLALQAAGLPVTLIGDAASPGIELLAAEEQGRRAGRGDPVATEPIGDLPDAPHQGILCICEDVGMDELEQAWNEGFRSTEIIKRYTTATMGPCRGQLCHRPLRAFIASQSGATGPGSGATTARAPTRSITLEEVSAGVWPEPHQRTALHERHLQLGATMEPAGVWQRPRHYGDSRREYWAVRRNVSLMDVGTLGKFLVAGPDSVAFLEHLYPNRIADLKPGRIRYAVLLSEHGFVVDDGVVCSQDDGQWYLTFTSSGAATVESHLKDWAEAWNHEVYIADLTAASGAINVAGPHARELLQRLSSDALDNESFPYLHHRDVTIADVPCRAMRLGFTGELSYELHHVSTESERLWNALMEAGSDLGIRPHGLDALRVLRLEKGHIIVGQDTDFDSTPMRLNMDWAIKLDKPWFVGKNAIERAKTHALNRKLVAVSFSDHAPPEGAPLRSSGREVGYLTSSAWSPALECGVSLGWVECVDQVFPTEVESDGCVGTIVAHGFYDPEGERLRA